MKKLTLLLVAILFAVTGILAQTPNQFKYQAVLRNADGTIMAEESVTVDIDILQGSATGTSVFTEQHSVTTTAQGLINLNIGSVSDMSVVDWSSATYFIEISVNGTEMGTSQLLSVPYAMYAETSGSSIPGPQGEQGEIGDTGEQGIQGETGADGADGTNGIDGAVGATVADGTNGTDGAVGATGADGADGATGADGTNGTDGVGGVITQTGSNVTITGAGTVADPYKINTPSTHYVGELFGGGIIYYIDQTGEHGLIASLDDLDGGSGVKWGLYTDVANCENMTDGATNTATIIAASPAAGTAAVLCNDYTGGGFTDWYLPANRELYLLCSQDILIDQVLDNDGDGTTNGFSQEYLAPTYGRYWSSTEDSGNFAWGYYFFTGNSDNSLKDYTYRVRAVRAF